MGASRAFAIRRLMWMRGSVGPSPDRKTAPSYHIGGRRECRFSKKPLRNGKLVWRGTLPADPVTLDITYTAVGKGLYELSVPPGGILDRFQVTLTAKGSDVRLLELSLQPTTDIVRAGGATTYTWNYPRLLYGQPVRLDVLGIAPIDPLGN